MSNIYFQYITYWSIENFDNHFSAVLFTGFLEYFQINRLQLFEMIDELFTDTVVICHHEELFTIEYGGHSLPLPGRAKNNDRVKYRFLDSSIRWAS